MKDADPVAIDEVVSALVQARRTGEPVPAPALADADAAYAVQAAVAEELGWFGGTAPRHWKSGGPSREAPLTHAPLPPAGVWQSPAVAGTWPFRFRSIEAEVALRLGEAVDAGRAASLDLAGARRLLDGMCVSIEVVDFRWLEAQQAPPLAKLADQQSHGALVLGAILPFVDRDWLSQVCRVRIGAQPERVFRGTHSMGDPAFVLLPWLRHVTRDGATVAAGTVVTTGTWCGVLDAQLGDEVQVAFDGIGGARVVL
jgi:2-keto-4-pentenoate hydratase